MSSNSKFGKRFLLVYSLGISILVQIPVIWGAIIFFRDKYNLSSSQFPLSIVFGGDLLKAWVLSAIQTTVFIFLFWLFVRWVASTAEKAGRSYVAFMIFAILMPPIAWIVAITFRKPINTLEA